MSLASWVTAIAPEFAVAEGLPIGVVGTGAMGHHHVRLLSMMAEAELIGIVEADADRARVVAEEFACSVFDSVGALADACEALVIAVPTDAHLSVALEGLDRGCHLLVEKPLAANLADGEDLVAAAGDRILAVGHVQYYNPAFAQLLALGRAPRYVEVQRRSGFTRRSLDIDVILDLMIHDLQLLHELDSSPVAEIRALGTAALSPSVDIANARLEFESGMVANLTASRVSVQGERQMRVFFPELYCSLDFDAMTISQYQVAVGEDGEPTVARKRLGDEDANPLQRELEAFVDVCSGGSQRIISGEEGLRALRTAIAVSEAIQQGPA